MSALKPRADNVSPNIDLLRGFKRHETDLILAAARVRRFPAKSLMTHQGEPADHLLLLWKGRARYFFETPNGRKLIMIWITPGHSFGGAALSTRPSPYLLSTETVRDSVVLAWDGGKPIARRRTSQKVRDLNFQMVAENPTWGARREILTESLPVGGATVVQLVFRVQTFAKGNCAMLRRCVDEILAKNTGATIVFESYRVSFGAF